MNRVHRKAPVQPTSPDPRHLSHGLEIPTESYSDQPFIVQTDDGAWLCAVTTGPGEEGVEGQHVVTQRSSDCGRTWSAPVPVELGDKRENSYAVMLKVPAGVQAVGRRSPDRALEQDRRSPQPPGDLAVGAAARSGDLRRTTSGPAPIGPVTLSIVAEPHRYQFLLGEQWLAEGETKFLSTEVAGGFTGVYFAMYATGNGQRSAAPADFDWFDYEVVG